MQKVSIDMNHEIKKIIKEAGQILQTAFYKDKSYNTKSNCMDLVTETDKQIEDFLVNSFIKLDSKSKFLAEESSPELKKSDVLWVIDPIDGTTNFVHKFPFVCISVGLLINGKLEKGYIYNPIMGEFFHSESGKGAFLNDIPIQVSKCVNLSQSFLGTGFAYNFASADENNIRYFQGMVPKVHGIRRPGSAALDLAYVAKGVYEGFWEWYLNPWDVCAGIAIIKEAGGRISNLDGNEYNFGDQNIVASNTLIHEEFLHELQKIRDNR
jgi:myo-inositol-1(or 4)-monophosphatase